MTIAACLERRRVLWLVDAERLKHAPQAVAQVQAQKADGDDVGERDPPHLKAGNHVVVDVALNVGRAGMDVAGGQVQQMEDDEGEHDGARPVHGPRGVGGSDGLLARIADRARALFAQGQLHGRDDVQRDANQQDDAHRPKHFSNAVQKRAVGIQFCRAFKDLKVAQQVPDHEDEQDDARDGHHDLLADCGGPEARVPDCPAERLQLCSFDFFRCLRRCQN